MSSTTPVIPEIPKEILDAIDDNSLLIFIGAGISKLYGYPLWNEMAHNLIEKCLNEKVITRSEHSILLSGGFNPMQLVTLAYGRLKSNIGDDKARELIIGELSEGNVKSEEGTTNKIAEYLSNYHCPIITTNADLSLEHSAPFKNVISVDNFSEWNEEKSYNKIFHIHGSIDKFEHMVFTSEQYAKAYMVGSPFSDKLLQLFKNDNTFLFIGYGANEFELIRYFLNAESSVTRNLFLLNGYLKCDEIKRTFDYEYYGSIGITLLPYIMEENGYKTIIDVLEKWDNDVTTKTMAHMHVIADIKKAFSEKPNLESTKFIQGVLSDGEDNQIIKGLLNSQYINEWIWALKDECIFSVDNIKPAKKNNDNTISSQHWAGLEVLCKYSKRGNCSGSIDGFIISLINESVKRFENDEKANSLDRLDSSFAILSRLSDLIFSRTLFINECNSESFVKIYLQAHHSFPFSLIHDVCNQCFEGVNKDKIFNILSIIVESNECEGGYELLVNDNIRMYIRENPYSYYEYAKEKLLSTGNYFWSMGAFADYPDSPIYRDYGDAIAITWLRYASSQISPDILVKDVETWLNSEKAVLKKCALALININYERKKELFWNHIELFISDEIYYSDLKLLLSKHFCNFDFEEKKLIKTSINNAKWNWQGDILKNHLLSILKPYDESIVAKPETKREIEIARNINRKIYVVDFPLDNKIEDISNQLKDLPYKDALDFYNKQYSGSFFYQDALNKAFLDYLLQRGNSFILERLSDFDTGFFGTLINYFEEDVSALLELTKVVNTKKCYEIYDSILYAIEKLVKDKKSENGIFEILKLIEHDYLNNHEDIQSDNIVLEIINDKIFTYLDIYLSVVGKNKEAVTSLKSVISKYMESAPQHKMKAIIAFNLNRIYEIDEDYAISLFAYAFDNQYKEYYPSYVLLRFGGIGSKILDHILKNQSFKDFISKKTSDNDEKDAQAWFASKIVGIHICDGTDMTDYLWLVFNSGNLYAIIESIRALCYYYKTQPFNLDMMDHCLQLLYQSFCDKKINREYDVDQLIRYLSELQIVISNQLEVIWKIIIKLFDGFKHYFSDETYELLKKYKDSNIQNVIGIMDKYVASYHEHETYEDTFRKTLLLFANDENYSQEYKVWKNRITKVNPDFFE